MTDGTRTTDLTLASSVDEVIGNKASDTVRVPVASFSAQVQSLLGAATETVLGLAKGGSNILFAADGTASIKAATALVLGGVIVGTGLVVDVNGKIDVVGAPVAGGAGGSTLEIQYNNAGAFGGVTGSSVNLANGSITAPQRFIGIGAGGVATNAAYGSLSLAANITGANNGAFGFNALAANTTGGLNAAFGVNALASNTTASSNSAFGANALAQNISTAGNAAFGASALFANKGNFNAAFGVGALAANDIQFGLCAFGASALAASTTGWQNVAVGYEAMKDCVSGARTVAIGYKALSKCVAGDASVAVGCEALANYNDIEGGIAIGNYALRLCTASLANIAIGNTAQMNILTGGGLNVTIGHHTLEDATTAGGNVAMGYVSGRDITTAGFNTLIGHNTGRGLTTGSNNTIIGGQVTGLSPTLASAVILATGDGTIRMDFNKTNPGFWTTTAPAIIDGILLNGAIKSTVYTVATLPVASSWAGGRAFVSDSNATLAAGLGNIVAGGAANFTPVYCDGTNWRIG